MLKFFRRKKETLSSQDPQIPADAPAATDASVTPDAPVTPTPSAKETSWFASLKHSLVRTRTHFGNGLATLFLGKKALDEDLLESIETQLLMSDVGIEATQHIIHTLTTGIARKSLNDAQAVYSALKKALQDLLSSCEKPPIIISEARPFVILMIGVNGAGKTTTIGKLAQEFQQSDYSVMLAAGDTFRAAAIEQLQVWGERNQVPVVAQHIGADSASVIFDAMQSAKAKGIDVLLADTAGRLHTRENLMDELKKVKRVMQKASPDAPHETWLVLDASTGQNGLIQAQKFHEAMHVTGIILTKLDGTAKGGVIFAIAHKLKIPIRFIGVGEKREDLRPFEAAAFVDALFSDTIDNG